MPRQRRSVIVCPSYKYIISSFSVFGPFVLSPITLWIINKRLRVTKLDTAQRTAGSGGSIQDHQIDPRDHQLWCPPPPWRRRILPSPTYLHPGPNHAQPPKTAKKTRGSPLDGNAADLRHRSVLEGSRISASVEAASLCLVRASFDAFFFVFSPSGSCP